MHVSFIYLTKKTRDWTRFRFVHQRKLFAKYLNKRQ